MNRGDSGDEYTMSTLINQGARYLVLLVAIEHVWIMIAEVFMWKSTIATDLFNYDAEEAETTALLARAHGVYSGLFGIGLMWAFVATGLEAYNLRVFLFSAILASGLATGATGNKKFLIIQTLPAGLGLLLTTWYS